MFHENRLLCRRFSLNIMSYLLFAKETAKIESVVYSVDKTFGVIKIMDLNDWTQMLQCFFSLCQFRLIKWSFFVHSTTRDAPYVHPRLDSILELWRTFPNASLTILIFIMTFIKYFLGQY